MSVAMETTDRVGTPSWLWLVVPSETMTIDYGTHGIAGYRCQPVYYSATESGTIDTMPDIPGLAVWHDGHIGVYIGGGQVIEAMGTKIWCCQNRIGWPKLDALAEDPVYKL